MRKQKLIMKLFITTILLSLIASINLSAQTLLASYPLTSNLTASFGGFGNMTASASLALPPSALCQTSAYPENAMTPNISTINSNSFQIETDFLLYGYPSLSIRGPIIVGGSGWRWIGIHVDNTGRIGVLYNNSNYIWSTTIVSTSVWHTAKLQYDNTHVVLFLDGVSVIDQCIPLLVTGNNLNFTTANFSNGGVINGCIRNLKLYNNPVIATPPCITPLADELLSTGVSEESNERIHLNWNIDANTGLTYFRLERSVDLSNWEELTTIAETTGKLNYEWTDHDPFKGISYYRLKYFDADESEKGAVIKSAFIDNDNTILIAPNPADDRLIVFHENSLPESIVMHQADGKKVEVQIIKSTGYSTELSVSHLVSGLYYISVDTETEKFIKK